MMTLTGSLGRYTALLFYIYPYYPKNSTIKSVIQSFKKEVDKKGVIKFPVLIPVGYFSGSKLK
jgi:hypothetical protein